jgi:LuxR family maltose regulon positive regulatory protein
LAIIAKDSPGQLGVITGDDRYVADYLYRESLSCQPKEVQSFLCMTAVLDRLSGPLCDAVLEASGGVDMLRRLEASSMFVVPLDRQRRWYRYHALFREFLLGELRRRASDDDVQKLHLRAADWYEANGSTALVVEHLLQTTETDRSLETVASSWLETYSAGRLSTIQRWQRAIGESGVERYPPLAVEAAWNAVLTGDPAEAERWATFVDSAPFHSSPTCGYSSLDSAKSMLRAAMCADGPEAMRAHATRTLAQEPAWGEYRDTALWLLGEAHLIAGQCAQASNLFSEASSAAERMHHPATIVISRSELAMLAMDRDDWEEGGAHLEIALTAMRENRLQDYLTSVLAHAQAARLALHRGALEDARNRLARAMEGRTLATYALPFIAVRLRLVSAKLHLALAGATAARHLVREIDDLLVRRPALGTLVEQVDDFKHVLASSPRAAGEPTPLSAAELRLLPYMQTHLTLRAIAERLFVSRNTVNSQVTSIYRKLGASSRREAVDRATAVGLLRG